MVMPMQSDSRPEPLFPQAQPVLLSRNFEAQLRLALPETLPMSGIRSINPLLKATVKAEFVFGAVVDGRVLVDGIDG